jgi:hypothetical protein
MTVRRLREVDATVESYSDGKLSTTLKGRENLRLRCAICRPFCTGLICAFDGGGIMFTDANDQDSRTT